MEWFEALALLLGTIMLLMAVGMPIALAFLAANIIDKIRADADPIVFTYGGNILPYRPWRPYVHRN